MLCSLLAAPVAVYNVMGGGGGCTVSVQASPIAVYNMMGVPRDSVQVFHDALQVPHLVVQLLCAVRGLQHKDRKNY